MARRGSCFNSASRRLPIYSGHLVALLGIRNLLKSSAVPRRLASSGQERQRCKDRRTALMAVAVARFVIGMATLGIGTAAVSEGSNRGE